MERCDIAVLCRAAGIGLAAAVPLALKRAGLRAQEIDLFELNQAFAAQSLAVAHDLGIDAGRVNVLLWAILSAPPEPEWW